MMEPVARRLQWLLVWTLALSLSLACGAKTDPLEREDEARLDELQVEINGLIEGGHEAEPLPVMTQDDLEELEVRMHRRQIADQMRAGVAEAMTPLVFAAALFAPEGAVDLLLAVLPAERIGDAAADIARQAFKARKRSKRARELARLSDEFHAALTPEARKFMRLADKLEEADLRALRTIYEYTRSPSVITKLMHKKINKDADVRWIAEKLERGRMDHAWVERFTFDAGVVEDITLHDSHLSWATLQRVVEGADVDPQARAMLAGKVQGLMGERAARDAVRSPGFMQKHLGRVDRDMASGQGLHYGMQYSGQRSIDVVAFSLKDEAIFVEVKTWSAETWNIPGQTEKIIEQLQRHDDGVREIIRRGNEHRTVKAKVLMVEESGYLEGLKQAERGNFIQEVEGMGWVIETIPSSEIRTFSELIDAIR